MNQKKMAIIASKGSLDMAYPPLILATTAAAMDMDVTIFFTFYGLEIVKKGQADNLQVVPLGNTSMPMPNIVGALPGMTAIATKMMKSMFKKHGVATIGQLLELARESGVKLIACQMTMDVLGIKQSDIIDGVEFGGAATFMDIAADSQISLFV
ncbi:MAG: NADH dehydrogenase [Nitrospirae bacterium GWC2_57_13]|nr:MAG: NADH dehydrogenase [Nitrospirae bacterium GWC2_57_13]OGW43173.1 MAG: NADH dehydrogenase [Nitrospirae bacterium GWD2_57_8]HAR46910.1 peroxiredoxin family protein [Nitrospiraceae bacterium]HAS54647.1 peroxiredoxin family protein [Nitrospiraceae bacterium]